MPSDDFATVTVQLTEPVTVEGREVRSVAVREPLAGDYIVAGPLTVTKRTAVVRASFELFEVGALYLRRGLVGFGEIEVSALLDALCLADTFRLIRALAPMVPRIDPGEVRYFQSILVFDWHMMSIREANAMGVEELFYNFVRLGEHSQRRAADRKRA